MIRSFYRGLAKPIGSATGNAPDKKKSFSGIFVIRLSVSVAILVFLIAWLSTETLVSAILSVPVHIWIIVISLFVVGHVISALKWRLMLKAASINIRAGLSVRAISPACSPICACLQL